MNQTPNQPEKLSLMAKFKQNFRMLKEIFVLLKTHKKWWLMPIFFIFAVLSMFIVLVGGGSILPAIYAIF